MGPRDIGRRRHRNLPYREMLTEAMWVGEFTMAPPIKTELLCRTSPIDL
jgi:hypothetical protein